MFQACTAVWTRVTFAPRMTRGKPAAVLTHRGDSNSLGRARTHHVDSSYQKWESAPQVDPLVLDHVARRRLKLPCIY
jgi:hypothetical protein